MHRDFARSITQWIGITKSSPYAVTQNRCAHSVSGVITTRPTSPCLTLTQWCWTFTVASYDRLKQLKRSKTLLDWKIQGSVFPIVDYGKAYINELSEASNVGEYLTFSGSMVGYGIPLTRTVGEFVLNDGDPDVVLTTNTDANFIIKTKDGN